MPFEYGRRRSPLPNRIVRCAASGSFPHGAEAFAPFSFAMAAMAQSYLSAKRRFQPASAPSSTLASGFTTRRPGSKVAVRPSPLQSGQAPWGLLNENVRGLSSANEMPQVAHAKRWLKFSSPNSPSGVTHVATMLCSARRSATPIESTRRVSMPGRITMRSTSTSMVCACVRASEMSSVSSFSCPSMRARRKPCLRRSASSFLYSPLRPRTMGASTSTFAFCGNSAMRAAICATVCDAISWPHCQQWGLPIVAYSRRR